MPKKPNVALHRPHENAATMQPVLTLVLADKDFKRGFGVPPVPRATVGRAGGVREPAAGRTPPDAAEPGRRVVYD